MCIKKKRSNSGNILLLLLIIFVLLFEPGFVSSGDTVLDGQKIGLNYITNYSTGLHPQNWSITQDKRGIIYVANNAAVLEFDGVSRRKIKIPNWTVRSLTVDENGTVYVGGISDFGYLAPDSKGSLQYVSLVDHIDERQKKFSAVLRVNAAGAGIYFRTYKYLFRRDTKTGSISVWETEDRFNASFICRETLFIHRREAGLLQMNGNYLQMAPRGEIFAGLKIYMMIPYDENRILIGTRSKGFYLYNKRTGESIPFPTEVDDYLKKNELYHGIKLHFSPGEFALATQQGGLVIIDSRGKLKKIFNKSSGLQDNRVNYAFEDSRGNLWLALSKGISKIEYASPFSIYDDKRTNLPGAVLSVCRHGPGNDIYAGTTHGLFRLTARGNCRFSRVPGITGNCSYLLSYRKSLLAATSLGVFQVDTKRNTVHKVITGCSYVLVPSKKNRDRLWLGTQERLISLHPVIENIDGCLWQEESKFKNIAPVIRTIVEDRQGNLWIGTRTNGVIKIDFPVKGQITHPVVTRYNRSHGLTGDEVRVFHAAGHVLFAAGKKLLRFDGENRTFIPDPTLGPEFSDGTRSVFRLIEDRNKIIWLQSEFYNFRALPRPGNTFLLDGKPFLRIPKVQVNDIYCEPGADFTWFASNDGLVCCDTRIKKKYGYEFPTLIRNIKSGKDVTVFGGYKVSGEPEQQAPRFPYGDRNLSFEFAAPAFENEKAVRYSYYLEGYDKGWSAWAAEPRKDYTNLDSGLYAFRVRGKDVFENISGEDVFRFRILPPWYGTWWAIMGYLAAVFLLMFLIIRWRSGKLVREKQRLEGIVRERTNEIAEKNTRLQSQTLQLEEQAERLKEMDKMKSLFFANISHEFRTPLTLIMGPIEQMLSKSNEKEQRRQLTMMQRNSRRLLSLINQLLDLSKLDSGKLKLHVGAYNIVDFLKGITAAFDSALQEKQIDLKFIAPEEDITMYFDAGKMEQLIGNLLSNAFKFTPTGGVITLSVTKLTPEYPLLAAAGKKSGPVLKISIRDTGIGIPADRLSYIFDRFYQVENDEQREQNHIGTGIGLALTKELLALHHGTIDVHSSEEEPGGTEFILRFPLGKEHWQPGEIVELPGEAAGYEISPQFTELYSGVKSKKTPGDREAVAEDSAALGIEPDPTGKNAETGDESAPNKKEIILIVDDNAGMREYIRGPFEPHYTVVEAEDGLQGIEKAHEIIPDLIISDVMMPGADGFELCRKLKKDVNTSHIPIILLTAKAGEESTIRGLETGADDYITKPFSTRLLSVRIRNLIDLRSRFQEKMQRRMKLQPAEISVSSVDETFLEELQGLIEKNLGDEEFNVDRLAKKLYMSRSNLYRKIQALTGETPVEFIRSYRLKRAAQLLQAGFGNVTEVAFAVGFSNTSYFSKCFKKKFHSLPSDYHESGGAAY
jgi:signal transduction histidine kinase/DNA-binding response OmpR family regulator